jgi:hypothetical protein
MQYQLSHIQFPQSDDPHDVEDGISPSYELTLFALGAAADYEGGGTIDVVRVERLIAFGHRLLDRFVAIENKMYGAIDRVGVLDRVVMLGGRATPVNDQVGPDEILRPLRLHEISAMHGEAMAISMACEPLVDEERAHVIEKLGANGLEDVTDRHVEGAMALWKIEMAERAIAAGDHLGAIEHYIVAGSLVGFAEFKGGFDRSPDGGTSPRPVSDARSIGRRGGQRRSARLQRARQFVIDSFTARSDWKSKRDFARRIEADTVRIAEEDGFTIAPGNATRTILDWLRAYG